MWLWAISFACAFQGLRLLGGEIPWRSYLPGLAQERARLRSVVFLLQEIEETLAAGLVPTEDRWARLRALPYPWASLAYDSLRELRSCGGALLPTLRRLRGLAQDHDAALGEARARSSQALAQAGVCALLVPGFGSALFFLLPAVSARPWVWCCACGLALVLAGVGAAWMLSMAEAARWGGLPISARPWVLASQCAGERFLALVRSGNPADLAWARACDLLRAEAPGLALQWGASVWTGPSAQHANSARGVLESAGGNLRKAVQVSLMEGRPCTERAEAALAAMRQDLRAQVDRELGLLGTRALQPLFICVAPALFLLLGFALWLSWDQIAGGSGGF